MKNPKRVNPLKVDPTRTAGLRRRWIADIMRAMTQFMAELQALIVTQDAFGLVDPGPLKFNASKVDPNVPFRAYAFQTSDQKLASFNSWLDTALEKGQFTMDGTEYVKSAYKQGVVRGYIDKNALDMVSAPRGYAAASQAAFLDSAFNTSEALSKIKLLATRQFENMKGLTQTMKSRMGMILAKGLANGNHPSKIAAEMRRDIGILTRGRALTIARTEIIHAHAEGQLDSMEKMGVDEVGAMVEWNTAGDSRVCDKCAALEGQVYTVKEARGLLPLHPNCRCAWVPYIPDSIGKQAKASRVAERVSKAIKKAAKGGE